MRVCLFYDDLLSDAVCRHLCVKVITTCAYKYIIKHKNLNKSTFT